jgi:hypothetical protein
MCDFSLGDPKWIEDLDAFATDVLGVVHKGEIPFLQGTFGLLLIVVTKYIFWLFIKRYFGVRAKMVRIS